MFFLPAHIQSLILGHCVITGWFQFIVTHCRFCLLQLFLELLLSLFYLVPYLKIFLLESLFRVFKLIFHLSLWLFKLWHSFVVSSMPLFTYLFLSYNFIDFFQLSKNIRGEFLEFEWRDNCLSFYTFDTEIIKLQLIKKVLLQLLSC